MKNKIVFIILMNLTMLSKLFSLEITNLTPVGGEIYQNSTTYTIHWDYSDTTGTIDLVLWNADFSEWDTLAVGIDGNLESYDWVVNHLPSVSYRLKAIATEGSSTYTMSLGYFTIEDAPQQYTDVEDGKVKPVASEIKVFPNPAIEKVNIEVNNEPINEIIVYDGNGLLYRRFVGIKQSNFTISTEKFPSGFYYIECIMMSGRRLTSKLVISK